MLNPRPTGAEDEVRRRIAAHGPIPFAEFMDVALYWPDGGYYSAGRPVGAAGDFYTAPHAHPAFGALLARRLLQLWRTMGSPAPFWVLELGAGAGLLGADITAHAAALGDGFGSALRYVALDVRGPTVPSARVDWVLAHGLPARGVSGVVLANELLDAMPVHRVVGHRSGVRELGVGLGADGALAEVEMDEANTALVQRLDSLGVGLGDGHRAEVNLGIGDWMHSLSATLDRGYALLIDYGHAAEDYYDASRARGTLRCYYQHTLNMDPYRHVGRQDIGAHVEFTSVRRAASDAGFEAPDLVSQAQFLESLGFAAYRDELAERQALAQRTREANLTAMDSLVDPEGMGSFQVLTLSKGVDDPGAAPEAANGLETPLLGPAHQPQPGGWDPPMPTWEELSR